MKAQPDVDGWIGSSRSNVDPNFGFIESFYHGCSSTLQNVCKARHALSLTEEQESSLKHDTSKLILWEENFPSSSLDTILSHSSYLRIEVLENLCGIGKILRRYCRRISVYSKDKIIPVDREDLGTLLEKATVILSEATASDSSSDSDTDSDCSFTTQAERDQHGRLQCYISCLMELGPAIERQIANIRFKLNQEEAPKPSPFSLSETARPFAIRIKDRFKDAQLDLVERLAEANWERSVRIRLQAEEENATEDTDHVSALAMTVFKPFSVFHDSGLGASIPTRSHYAATVASHSSFMSVFETESEGRPRVPPLPLEGENGRSFQCMYCGKHISCRNRIQWKMHVFADLQAYICTRSDCKDSLRTFETRELWADHEFNNHFSYKVWTCFVCSTEQDSSAKLTDHLRSDHDMELLEPLLKWEVSRAQKTRLKPEFADHPCPLCLKSGWQTKKAYATHVGRHMEEISLACLPTVEDDESDSDSDASRKLNYEASSTSSNNGAPVGVGHLDGAESVQSSSAVNLKYPVTSRNGVPWVTFEYSQGQGRRKLEYTIRCDLESVDVDDLSRKFKSENCAYPRSWGSKAQYRGDRLIHEMGCNSFGWALAKLNPNLRGNRGLIQRAVDSLKNYRLGAAMNACPDDARDASYTPGDSNNAKTVMNQAIMGTQQVSNNVDLLSPQEQQAILQQGKEQPCAEQPHPNHRKLTQQFSQLREDMHTSISDSLPPWSSCVRCRGRRSRCIPLPNALPHVSLRCIRCDQAKVNCVFFQKARPQRYNPIPTPTSLSDAMEAPLPLAQSPPPDKEISKPRSSAAELTPTYSATWSRSSSREYGSDVHPSTTNNPGTAATKTAGEWIGESPVTAHSAVFQLDKELPR